MHRRGFRTQTKGQRTKNEKAALITLFLKEKIPVIMGLKSFRVSLTRLNAKKKKTPKNSEAN